MSAYSLPRCSKCGNSSGPWRPTGETLPESDEQALVCSTGCPAELAAAVDAMGGALPMPVGTADVTAEQEPVRGPLWSLLDWSLWGAGMGDTFREPLADTMLSAVPAETVEQAEAVMADFIERRQIQKTGVTVYQEQRDEVDQLRARVAELEALKPAPIQTCRNCGAGYDYGQPCSMCEFKKRVAAELAKAPSEDPHDSPLHHTYATPRDLPEVTR